MLYRHRATVTIKKANKALRRFCDGADGYRGGAAAAGMDPAAEGERVKAVINDMVANSSCRPPRRPQETAALEVA